MLIAAFLFILVTIDLFVRLTSLRKEEEMLAMLYAQQIMLGKRTFKQVPAKLKPQVKEILIDSGLPELVEE